MRAASANFTIATLLLFTAAVGTGAPAAGKVWRVGYLDQGSAAHNTLYLDGLRDGLRERGWVEGQNITIEARFAEGKTDRLPALAADLVRLKMDLIVTRTTPAALAAKQVTTTIPVVFGMAADPVGSEIVASLARPGGNITGWTHQGLELRAKYLELLKEAVPAASRFGVLWNPANQVHKPSLKVIEDTAERLRVKLHLAGLQDPGLLESTLSDLVIKGTQALVVFPDGMLDAQAPLIIAFTARHRLPTMYGFRAFPERGGLMSYGTNAAEMHRQVGASLVDKILRGANPGSLPVAQPTKFELVINRKTATTLGLSIPPSLLVRTDHVIE